jgi:hypothetical protein
VVQHKGGAVMNTRPAKTRSSFAPPFVSETYGRGAGSGANSTVSAVRPKIPGHTWDTTFSLAAEYAA